MNPRALALLLAAAPVLAFGHAVVTPAESSVGQTQQYTLHVPNEKGVPTVVVKLLFPAQIEVTTVDEQAGWRLALERDPKGRIVGATWTGSLPPKANVGFTFSARNPAGAATVVWNVVQTYEGNLAVEWTGPVGSKTPASRTNIH
jgi:YD repeat-containing protein